LPVPPQDSLPLSPPSPFHCALFCSLLSRALSCPLLGGFFFVIRRKIITVRPYRRCLNITPPPGRSVVRARVYSDSRSRLSYSRYPTASPPLLISLPRRKRGEKSPSRQDDRARFNLSCLALVAFLRSLFRSLPSATAACAHCIQFSSTSRLSFPLRRFPAPFRRCRRHRAGTLSAGIIITFSPPTEGWRRQGCFNYFIA